MQIAAKACLRHAMGAALCLLVGVFVCVGVSAATQNRMGALWIAASGGILNISTDHDEIRFEIPHALGVSIVAVNDTNGDLWAYGKKRLHRYTREGQPLLAVDVPASTHGGDPVDIVVDDASGHLWLAIQRDLYRFDFQGQIQQTILLPREAVALSLDRFRSRLWVAMGQELRIHDRNGTLIGTVALGRQDNVGDLAYDRAMDQVWVNLTDRLHRYDPSSGHAIFERAGDFSGTISPDGARGLWRAHGAILEHIDETGHRAFSLEPFTHHPAETGVGNGRVENQVVDLVADPRDASVWVASQRRIEHYASDGALLSEPSPEMGDGVIRKLHRAALYSDVDPPEIGIVAPADGSLLNQNRPTFELRYFDLGVGVDPETIRMAGDGQAIAVSCETGPTHARCTPDAALSEGERQIGATVADFAGNPSDPDTLRIAIDTLPPEITVTQPTQDSTTHQPNLAIRGSLNESGTLTIRGASVELGGNFAFAYDAQLHEGGNIFELAATDRAGNWSGKTLRVNLDTVPPGAPDTNLITVGDSLQGKVTVTGDPGSVEPSSTVRITNLRNGKSVMVAAAADGRFHAVIEAEPGDALSIVAVDAASNASSETRAQVASARVLTINEPTDGATVSHPSVLVAGSIRAPLNSAIGVNGLPATMQFADGTLYFYASVPLAIGTNTLSVDARFQDGTTITKEIMITRATAAYSIHLSPQVGSFPLVTQYSVEGTRRADQLRFDFNGDGQVDLVRAGSSMGVVVFHTYNVAGLYHPTVEILAYNPSTGRNNLAFQQTLGVVVFDPQHAQQHLDWVLRSVWSEMTTALLAGDIPGALAQLSPGSRDTYRQTFEALGPRMADVVNESGEIQPIEISDGIADYTVLNVHGGKSRMFIVNFIQGPDGIWWIDSL